MPTLWRRTSFALALAAGLGSSQAPEYVQQYRQRLGGAIDELGAVVAAFDADSAKAGMTHDQGLQRLSHDDDVFVRDRADACARKPTVWRNCDSRPRRSTARRRSENFMALSPISIRTSPAAPSPIFRPPRP